MNRISLTKKQEKSPVLNVRKNNSINAALKANQNCSQHHHVEVGSGQHQQQQQQPQHQKTQKMQISHSSSPPPQSHSYSVTPDNMSAVSSDDDSDHINVDKLKTIRSKAAQRYCINI